MVDFTEDCCFALLDVSAKDLDALSDCRYFQYELELEYHEEKWVQWEKKWDTNVFHYQFSVFPDDAFYKTDEQSILSYRDSFGDHMGMYSLKYGVSDEGKLEIRLVYSENGIDTVYHHFPLEYEWDFWKYAISGSGAIAWADPSTGRLFISDGESEIALPEDQRTFGCFTWRDDTTLLYLNDGAMGIDQYTQREEWREYHPLMAYHTDTGLCEIVRSGDGQPIFIDNMVHDAAVDPSGTLLAYGIILGTWSWNTYVTVAVTSLENGETQLFDAYWNISDMLEDSKSLYNGLYDRMELAWLP